MISDFPWNGVFAQIVLILISAVVLALIGRPVIGFLVRRGMRQGKNETKLDHGKRVKTVTVIFRTTYTALLVLITISLMLTALGVNVSALITGAGLAGVIIGLSAQNTVKDLLAGMFIVLEQQYRVGDTISLSGGTTAAGATGKVEEITLRATRLRDQSGNLITVRNGDPTIITNKTFSDASLVLDFTITYDSDITAVEHTFNAVGKELSRDPVWAESLRAPIQFTRVDDFTPTGVVVRAVGVTAPARQWDIAGEYRKRLLEAVAKNSHITFSHS
jgi:small conductance mechanosensitive channel